MIFLWFTAGSIVGGGVAAALLCCMQINRLNKYEREIQRLRDLLDRK